MKQSVSRLKAWVAAALDWLTPAPIQPRSNVELLAVNATKKLLGRSVLHKRLSYLEQASKANAGSNSRCTTVQLAGTFSVEGVDTEVESSCQVVRDARGRLVPDLINLHWRREGVAGTILRSYTDQERLELAL